VNRLQSIALDYVRDVLYIVEGTALSALNLNTLRRHVLSHGISPYVMISFDNNLFYVSREDRSLVKRTISGESSVSLHRLRGTHFSAAINNSLYYENSPNPCKGGNCSHLCVLSENRGTSCVCPDKYVKQTGDCVYAPKADGVVKMSPSRMDELCRAGRACYNGGECNATLTCDCPPNYTGVYCDVKNMTNLRTSTNDGSGGAGMFILFFIPILCSVIALLFYFLNRKYPQFLPHVLSKCSAYISSPRSCDRTYLTTPRKSASPSILKKSPTTFDDEEQAPILIPSVTGFINPLLTI
jgi:hypothetical protein